MGADYIVVFDGRKAENKTGVAINQWMVQEGMFMELVANQLFCRLRLRSSRVLGANSCCRRKFIRYQEIFMDKVTDPILLQVVGS